MKKTEMPATTQKLVDWYRKNRFLYPWRKSKDPYRVWLSEILLQQTRIPVALGYYRKILAEYPTIQALVRSDPDVFVSSWSGIGYYSRARNMIQCAHEIVTRHKGAFPSDLHALLQLPGIGPYTAGAIRNICFGKLTPAMDGNISRVLARITGNRHPMDSRTFRQEIESAFLRFGQNATPADFFQSLMELGERVCLPVPGCPSCPVRNDCRANLNGTALELPIRRSKSKPQAFHWYFVVLSRRDSRKLYVLNQDRSFLKDAWMFPDILTKKELDISMLRKEYSRIWGIELTEISQERKIRHSVTFRKIHGHILTADSYRLRRRNGKWLSREELEGYPTSSITHKILNSLQGHGMQCPTFL